MAVLFSGIMILGRDTRPVDSRSWGGAPASVEKGECRDHLDLQDLLVLQALRDRWVLRVNPVHGPVRLEPSRVPNR